MAVEGRRKATIELNSNEHPTFAKVTLPHKITQPELNQLINEEIVNNIVRVHTGCTCLSGTISILIESVFQEAVQVELGAAQ